MGDFKAFLKLLCSLSYTFMVTVLEAGPVEKINQP